MDFGNLTGEPEMNSWKPEEEVKAGVLTSSPLYLVACCVAQLCLQDVPYSLETSKQPYSDPSASFVPSLWVAILWGPQRLPAVGSGRVQSTRAYLHLNWDQLHWCPWKTLWLGPRPCDRGDNEVGPSRSTQPVTPLYICHKGQGILSRAFSEAAVSSAVRVNDPGSGHPHKPGASAPFSQSLPTHSRAGEIWFVVGLCGSLLCQKKACCRFLSVFCLAVHLCLICRHFHLVISTLEN